MNNKTLAKLLSTIALMIGLNVSVVSATEQFKKKVYVGIDLGTTFSCVSMYDPDNKSYEYLTYDKASQETIPSTIYFTGSLDSNGNPLYKVGYKANDANQSKPDPKAYFYGFKRMVGIDHLDPKAPLSAFPTKVTYPIVRATSEGKGYYYCPIEIEGKVTAKLTPTDLSSIILGELKSRIDAMNYKIIATAITTPVYFTSVQDNEVRLAGESAGFTSPLITKEPIAACVSYVDEHVITSDVEEKVLVFDFGGGTLDISIVETIKEESSTDPKKYESSVTAKRFVGDNFLGGENINDLIVDDFISRLPPSERSLSPTAMLRLRNFVENFKIDLCNKEKEAGGPIVHSDYFTLDNNTEIKYTLTSEEFNRIVTPVYQRIETLLSDHEVGLFKEDTRARMQGDKPKVTLAESISKTIFVGGSTRIPYIKQLIRKFCPHAPVYDGVDADKAVGRGAAQICANADPESGEASVTVLGAVPLPIGIKVFDGSFQEIIRKDISIPTDASMPFTTVFDNQAKISISIGMGVRPMFNDNEKLGELELELKHLRPKGVPQITVRIDYHKDYSFTVTATDKESEASAFVTINSSLAKPSASKIASMLEVAKQNELNDAEIKNKLEQVRLFDSALSMLEAQVKQAKLSELDQSYFETVIEGNKKWLSDNKETIKASVVESKLEDLRKTAEELALKIKESGAPMGEPQPEQKPAEAGQKQAAREVL